MLSYVSFESFREAYSIAFGILVTLIGLWTLAIDAKHVEKKRLHKESRVYRWLGLIYMLLGLPTAILLKLL